MKYILVVVRDSKLEDYSPPMCFPRKPLAIRALTDEINNPNSTSDMYKHPEDFQAFVVGEYDSETAQCTAKAPELLLNFNDVAMRN